MAFQVISVLHPRRERVQHGWHHYAPFSITLDSMYGVFACGSHTPGHLMEIKLRRAVVHDHVLMIGDVRRCTSILTSSFGEPRRLNKSVTIFVYLSW